MSCNTASSTCNTGWLNSTSPTTNENDGSGFGEETAGGRNHVPVWKVFAFLIMFIIMAVGIAGNLLVCIAVYSNHHLRKKSYFFFVSLAVADLLRSALIVPFAIYHNLTGRWVFGVVFCDIWISCDLLMTTASILSLCIISLDRFLHVKNPFTYMEWMTDSKCAGCIASVWLVSTLLSVLPASLGLMEKDESADVLHRTEEGTVRCEFDTNLTYAIVSSLVSFYIPTAVMVAIFIRLFRYSRLHSEAIRKTTATGFPGMRKKHVKHSYKAAQTLGIVMGAFLVCWLPLFIIFPIGPYCRTCIPLVAVHVANWFGYANSCLNPIIYAAFNKEFRLTFCQIICPSTYSRRRTVSGCVGVGKRTSIPGHLLGHLFGPLFESFRRAHLNVRGAESLTTIHFPPNYTPSTTFNFTSEEAEVSQEKTYEQKSSSQTVEQTDRKVSQEKTDEQKSSSQTVEQTDRKVSQEKTDEQKSSSQTVKQTNKKSKSRKN